MPANSNNLGSAAIGMSLDLQGLAKDANKAQGILNNLQKSSEGGKGGGLLSSITGSGGAASSVLNSLGNGGGIMNTLSAGVRGLGTAFKGLGPAAGAGAAGVGATVATAGVAAIAIAALVAVIAGAVLAYKGLQLAADQASQSLTAAGDQQALETSFKVLAGNLKLGQGQIAGFRGELEKLDYTSAEQTQIMQKLTNALGSNGLSSEALNATKAMRDLSVVAGVSSKQGVDVMANAVGSLNTEVLKQFGILGTSTQHFDAYGATIGKSADEMSNAEKQHAILNAVINQGAQSMGAADAARNDFNRLLVRTQDNAKQLQAAVGQMFLPLASGVMSVINTEILGLSRNADENRAKFVELGNRIRNTVLPAIQQFIAWLKAIPWDRVINGFLIAIQYARIFGAYVIMAAKQSYGSAQIIVGVFQIVASAIYALQQPISLAIKAASAMWRALKGEISPGQAFKEVAGAAKQSANGVANGFSAAFKNVGKGFGTIANASIDFAKTTINAINTIRDTDFKKLWAGLPKGMADGAEEALNEFVDTAGDMGEEGLKAAKKLAEDLAKENEDFARNQAKALKDFQEQLSELVAQHRDQIASIRKDIAKETKNYEKAQNERAAAYQANLAELDKADRERKGDVNKQLAEELAKGRNADQTKIASLRSRLAYEDSAHKAAVDKATQSYEKETNAAKEQYDERFAELQIGLNKELAIQTKHADDFARLRDYQVKDDITKLKEKYAEQRAEDERAHKQRIADMIKQGAEQAKQSKANGQAAGQGYTGGMGGALGAGAPGLFDQGLGIGKGVGNETARGVQDRSGHVGGTFRNILSQAAAGAAVGAIFGPVGLLIGSVVGAYIGSTGGTVGGALRQMFNSGIAVMGNLRDYGATIMRRLGQSIRDSLPGPIKGPFQSAWNGSGLPAFAEGGIVGGPKGKDRVIAAVSAGEMILNRDQQTRMFNMLDGKSAGSGFGSSGGGVNIENLTLQLPGVRNASDFERELKLKFATMRS